MRTIGKRQIGYTVAVAALLALAYWVLRPGYSFPDVIDGSRDARLTKITIRGQGRTCTIDDAHTLEYLQQCFRSTRDAGIGSEDQIGPSYDMRLSFAHGHVVNVGASIPPSGKGFLVTYPLDSLADPKYYWVPFAPPLPAELQEQWPPLYGSK